MLANFVANFLNTSLLLNYYYYKFSKFGGPKSLLALQTKIGGGAVPLVSTGSGPHALYSLSCTLILMYGVRWCRWTIQSNYRLAQVSFLNRPCFYKWKFLARSWKLWRRFPSPLISISIFYISLLALSWKTYMKVFHFRETSAKSGKCFMQDISCFCKRLSCSASDLHLHFHVSLASVE